MSQERGEKKSWQGVWCERYATNPSKAKIPQKQRIQGAKKQAKGLCNNPKLPQAPYRLKTPQTTSTIKKIQIYNPSSFPKAKYIYPKSKLPPRKVPISRIMEKRAPSFQSTPHMASQTINGLFRTVSPTVQIALLSITRRFEEMDATINAQLQSLTPSIATSSIGAGEEEPHIGSRSTSYKTSEEDMLAYLEESTFKKSWMQGLSSLSNKWAQSNMSDTSGEALFQIKLLERAADRLPDLLVAACAGNRLPSSVVLGIESRIEVVETFLDSCESLMQIKHVGLGSNTASYSDRP